MHIANIYHQFSELKKLKEELKDTEVIVHVDFSENYSCKHFEEIQNVHFGGSHAQVSLHTRMYYTANDGNTSFCTVSSCNGHDPSGIWGHMTPILKKIRAEHPQISTVHFVSDGPTTQYRNKTNFDWLLQCQRSMGFVHVTWNFLEAGHGKGAPDGIGGVIKRTADGVVSAGNDIVSAEALVEKLKEKTTVYMELVTQRDIQVFDKVPDLKPVDGAMKIHQVSIFHKRPR